MELNFDLQTKAIVYCHQNLDFSTRYRIRFNFRGVKLSRNADFSNFRVFIFADAGS